MATLPRVVNLQTSTYSPKVKCTFSIEFPDSGVICHDFRIFEGNKGLFLGEPSRKVNDNWVKLVEISDKGTRDYILQAALSMLQGADEEVEVKQAPAYQKKKVKPAYESMDFSDEGAF